MMSLGLTAAERGLVGRWIGATVVGWLVGFVLCEALKGFVSTLFVDGFLIGATVGVSLGIAFRGRPGFGLGLVLATIIGFGLGKAGGDIASSGMPTLVAVLTTGVAIGACVGIAQWFALRRGLAVRGWWVIANIAAWTVGWAIIGLVEDSEGLGPAAVYGAIIVGAAAAATIVAVALVALSRPRPA